MKLSKYLTGIFLLFSTILSAQTAQQDSLIQYYWKYPQKALQDADKIYKQATKEHNNPLLIKSLILKTTFSLKINQSEYPQLLAELENHIQQEKDTNVKSILYSYAGQLYTDYFSGHYYVIRQRTPLKEAGSADLTTWSTNLFKEKIFDHILASIAAGKQLQETPVSSYDAILITGAASDTLRPTLYDFLCQRAIEILDNYNLNSSGQSFQFPAEALGNLTTFLNTPVTPIPLNAPSQRLKIWQELLTFRQHSKNINALLMADLERLNDTYKASNLPDKDSLYLITLQEMHQQYQSTPMVVEIIACEANQIIHRTNLLQSRNRQDRQKREKALSLCEEGIRQYPHYPRLNLLREIIQTIKTPDIYCEFPQTIYTGETLPTKINFKNISPVSIALYQIQMSTREYRALKGQKGISIPRTLIYRKNYSLPTDLIYQDTTLNLSVPRNGLYEIEMKAEGTQQKVSDNFICTSLFTTVQTTKTKNHFLVRDWQSGQPVKNAKIILYRNNYPRYSIQTILDSVYTDAQGRATFPSVSYPLTYQVTNATNPNSHTQTLYSRNHIEDSPLLLRLITDRQIYRPGQTVYYKGYTWKESPDTVYALNKRPYEIRFLDANRKEIARQKVISNEFGTFTGSFVIPAQTLNGVFHLVSNGFTSYIQVDNYKRPEFEITFTEPTRPYYAGDTIVVKGKVSSFSGVPVGHTTIRYEIKQNTYFSRMSEPAKTIQGISQTNADGSFEFGFQSDKPAIAQIRNFGIYTYQVTATITDTKGETQENTITFPVYPGVAKPILNIPGQINKDQKNAFVISLSNLPEQTTGRTVWYSLDKLVTSRVITSTPDTVIEKNILKGNLQIQQTDSIFPDLHSYPSGAYLFTVQCDGFTEKSIFYLYSLQDKRPPIPTYSWLLKEKTVCRRGDTARIRFGTSVQDAYITYEIFNSNKLIRQKNLILSNGILNIDIPYLPEYSATLWLSIGYVKDKHFIQEIVPIKRIREDAHLSLHTKVFRDKLYPGQEEQWEITIQTDKDKPAFAEVLAMMYDASLDQIIPYDFQLRAGYTEPYFYGRWQDSYDYYTRNNLRLSFRNLKRTSLKVPDFRFDRLNLYSRVNDGDMMMEFYDAEDTGETNSPVAQAFTAGGLKARSKESGIISRPEISLRQDFQETAFFYPQLRTDSSGCVKIKFRIPESLTKWKFIALATTPSMSIGQMERYITTSKPLMIRPNLPRFLRYGDQNHLKAIISNLSDSLLQGVATLEFLLPGSDEVIFSQQKAFQTTANTNTTVGFDFTVPSQTDLLICRLTAISGNFSDGEQNLLPVLPDEILVTHTLPIYTHTAGTHTFTLSTPGSNAKDYRLTLELTANPIWYVVQALPNLTEPANPNITDIAAAYYVNSIASRIIHANPKIAAIIRQWNAHPQDPALLSKLEQNRELKSILLEASPWVLQAQNETERQQSLIQLFDVNRLNDLRRQAMEKMASLQTGDGGWAWFKGMNSSRFMTFNVLTILARANTLGEQEYGEQEKTMQIKAIRNIDEKITEDYKHKPKTIGYDQILYLYVRSLYRDLPFGEALTAHKYFTGLARKQWADFSLYEKAIASIALKNYGFTDDARQILNSLRQYAVTTPEQGMYWPNNRNNSYRNSAVQVHTAILEAFHEIDNNNQELNLMKQWLLGQKQVQSWGSVPATVDAIYALLLTGSDLLAQQDTLQVKLGKYDFVTPAGNNPSGYLKETFTGQEIQHNMQTVRITKSTDTPSWGGLYLQRFEKLDEIKGQKTGLSIEKKLFIARTGKNGKTELVSLKDQPVKTGDQVVVHLTLSLDRDMEFLHLKDLRAACFEPVEQLSGNQWKFGSVYYQDTKDAATNFFFNALSRGTYVIEYPVWVNQAGNYQDGIATFQSIYAPEFNSFSNAERIEVTP